MSGKYHVSNFAVSPRQTLTVAHGLHFPKCFSRGANLISPTNHSPMCHSPCCTIQLWPEKFNRKKWQDLLAKIGQFLILKGRTFSRQMLAFKKFHFFYASFCNIEETREIRKSYLRGHIVSHTEIGHSVTLKKNLFLLMSAFY